MTQPISGPTPSAPRDGLAGAEGAGVRINPPSDPLDPNKRWPTGFRIESDPVTTAGVLGDGSCAYTPGAESSAAPFVLTDPVTPVTIDRDTRCSAIASPDQIRGWSDRAKALLEVETMPIIAREMWTGFRSDQVGTGNPRLVGPSSTVLSPSPVTVVEAIAAMEDAFGESIPGLPQLIHVPRKAVAYLAAAGLVSSTPASGRIWSTNSSLVIADRGYPGFGPDAAPPVGSVVWMASTGPVEIRTTTIVANDSEASESSIDPATNSAVIRATRLFGVAWAGPTFVIPVDLAAGV